MISAVSDGQTEIHAGVQARGASREAFPGQGRMRPDDAEVARLRRELAKTQAERDISKKDIAYFAKEPR